MTAIHFFPVALTQKATSGGHSWAIESQIHSDHLSGGSNIRFRERNDHMQPVFPFAHTQICGRNLGPPVSRARGRNLKGDTQLSGTRREANGVRLPVEGIRFFVVTNRTVTRTRLTDLAPPGFTIKDRFQRLGRFDASLDEQITDQTGTAFFGRVVGQVMQASPVLFLVLPPRGTHLIKSNGELGKRLGECSRLLWGRMQLYSYRSVHREDIPSLLGFDNKQAVNGKKGRAALPPLAEAEGYPRRIIYGSLLAMYSRSPLMCTLEMLTRWVRKRNSRAR